MQITCMLQDRVTAILQPARRMIISLIISTIIQMMTTTRMFLQENMKTVQYRRSLVPVWGVRGDMKISEVREKVLMFRNSQSIG